MVAQTSTAQAETVLVIPFENQSKAPGIEWIGESFPELLEERLSSPTLFVMPREDRLRAYDRANIPAEVHPSRATIYRIAEQLDADCVVLGRYNFDGRTFTAAAQLLDMRNQKLLPEVSESGPLTGLIDIQAALAWDLLHMLRPQSMTTRQAYLAGAASVRLDAFENYVRGIIAPTADEQLRRFGEAVRLSPDYFDAVLQLGKVCYRQAQYQQAVSWLSHIPPDNPNNQEANFYLGLAAYYQGDMAQAEKAFRTVESRLPLNEVYNNLGVVLSHHDRKNAAEYFARASEADPDDPDYCFNLGVELYQMGDLSGAARQLHQALTLRPDDPEAKSLSDAIAARTGTRTGTGAASVNVKVPIERIRANYDESSFRQLALKIDAAAEQRLAKSDPRRHAQFHADRGHELLGKGSFLKRNVSFVKPSLWTLRTRPRMQGWQAFLKQRTMWPARARKPSRPCSNGSPPNLCWCLPASISKRTMWLKRRGIWMKP